MRYFILFIFFSLTSSCSENRYHENLTVNPSDSILFLKENMKPINGLVYNDYGDIGEYSEGKKNGIHQYWYDSGELMRRTLYNDGVPSLKFHEYFFKNGQLRIEIKYKNGFWYFKEWYENGQLKKKGSQVRDKNYVGTDPEGGFSLVGLYSEWFENGQLKIHGNFCEKCPKDLLNISDPYNYDDELDWSFLSKPFISVDGFYKQWYKNGNLKYEVEYDKGVKSGILKEVNKNKTVIRHEIWKSGVLVEKFI